MASKILAVFLLASSCLAEPLRIIRPCMLNDYKCIRDNLSVNSKCNRDVTGSMPGEYTINEFRYETPYFNSSYIDRNLVIRNHNLCRVSEFFFNVETGTVVLGIDCPQLDFESERTLIQHYSMQEDTSYSYHIRGTYPLIRFTLNIPKANARAIDVCSTYVFAEVTALPKFHVDPNNRPTANFLTKDLTNLNIYEIETFAYRGPPIARTFINSMLCDFGCK